jgi:uncharacterized protein (DUF1778 family)
MNLDATTAASWMKSEEVIAMGTIIDATNKRYRSPLDALDRPDDTTTNSSLTRYNSHSKITIVNRFLRISRYKELVWK